MTKAVLEETNRFVDTRVKKLSVEEYQVLLESSPLHSFYDQLLRKCYQEAKNANFSIRPDSFCGYGLFYSGADVLETSKQKDCLEGLCALLEVIDDEDQQLIKPISIFQATEVCKKSRVMIGAVRFANHSCKPNCKYDIKEVNNRKRVKLRLVRDISPGEELTVFYGNSFFGENICDCLCPYKESHLVTVNEKTTTEKLLYLKPTSKNVVVNSRSNLTQHRRRLFVDYKSRKRVKLDSELRNFPSDSSDDYSSKESDENNSSENSSNKNDTANERKNVLNIENESRQSEVAFNVSSRNLNNEDISCASDANQNPSSTDVEESLTDSDINSTTISTDIEEVLADSDNDLVSTAFDEKSVPVNNENSSPNGLANGVGLSNNCRYLISSPNESQAPLIVINDVSEIGSPEGGLNESSESTEVEQPDELSQISIPNFRLCVNAIIAKHGSSDAEASDWIRLLKLTNKSHQFPSFKSIKKTYHSSKRHISNSVKRCASGDVFFLNFVQELQDIVQKNIAAILKYDSKRERSSDLKIPTAMSSNQRSINIYLLINSDGVRLLRSSGKSLWPVWFAVANLPSKLRSSFKNIVLASLWFGFKKPSWNHVFEVSFSVVSLNSNFYGLLKLRFFSILGGNLKRNRILNFKRRRSV